MKQDKKAGSLKILFRLLLVIVLLLALVLLAGTLYALVFRNAREAAGGRDSAGMSGGKADSGGQPRPGLAAPAEPDSVFSGLGRIRTSSGGSEPAAVIVSIAFPYAAADKDFSAELASRIGDFRALTEAYFSSLSAAELRTREEAVVKAELLERFNGLLRLGRIGAIYFSDYMIIE
ncbi:MAG: flagellar basal body protein FliL [Treponema sp.]|jgi:flagellar basal body-associated protein FliL|nr:flagellar basal body protein FliL [Treponema sp.]